MASPETVQRAALRPDDAILALFMYVDPLSFPSWQPYFAVHMPSC